MERDRYCPAAGLIIATQISHVVHYFSADFQFFWSQFVDSECDGLLMATRKLIMSVVDTMNLMIMTCLTWTTAP
jgi:hypothetical protein